MPLYARLPEADREELRGHILVFLAEKRFEGCGGLEITDEIKVTIAAHACILLLHRKTDYYPGLKSILVYPDAFVVPDVHHVVEDMVLEGDDVRLGESWHHGAVVLSWDDVRRSAADVRDGQNVAFHEFAHQLDSSGGRGDSTPVLKDHSSFIAWARSLGGITSGSAGSWSTGGRTCSMSMEPPTRRSSSPWPRRAFSRPRASCGGPIPNSTRN